MKRILLFLVMILVLSFSLPALGITVTVNGEKQYFNGEYADAFLYSSGSFSYDSYSVDTVNVNWLAGGVDIVQKKGSSLFVSESVTGLSEGESLHYLIKDRTLYIQFTQSGYDYTGKIEDKNLTLEIPYNINVYISSGSSVVRASDISVEELSLSSISSKVDVGNVECDGNIHLATVSGDFSFTSIDSENVLFSSTSGSISIGEVDADTVSFSTSSGDVTLKRGKFDRGTISASSGDKYLSNIECEELSLIATSGKAEGNNIDVKGKLLISGSSGDCSFLNLNVLELSATLSCGNFLAQNIWINSVILSTSSGDVALSLVSDVKGNISTSSGNVLLSRVQNDTSVVFSTVSGHLGSDIGIRKNGDGSSIVGEGKYSLTVKTISGLLEVD